MEKTPVYRVQRDNLEDFCSDIFGKLGMSPDKARDCSEILVAADARGIGSHGVARLWRYVNGIQAGIMKPETESEVIYQTPISRVIDAHGGIGLSLSKSIMKDVVQQAEVSGFSVAAVRDSNHFGVAGYYAMMALPKDMIGIAMTNTAALGVATFGRDVQFGTNPIAVAVPAAEQPAFVLDMATTVVTRGKIEEYHRESSPLPKGWAVDKEGADTSDSASLLQDMLVQAGGGILPLGGRGEEFGGHKGFGLGVLVDIMTAVTSGGIFGKSVVDSKKTSARVCHSFAAMRVDLFREASEFKADMDKLLLEISNSNPAVGQDRVYYAGLKEYEHELKCGKIGIPVTHKVWNILQNISIEQGVNLPEVM